MQKLAHDKRKRFFNRQCQFPCNALVSPALRNWHISNEVRWLRFRRRCSEILPWWRWMSNNSLDLDPTSRSEVGNIKYLIARTRIQSWTFSIVVYEGGSVMSQARSLWRLELARTKWSGGFINWYHPMRFRHLTTGRYLGVNENNELVLVSVVTWNSAILMVY